MISLSVDFVGKQGLENLIRYIEDNLVYGEIQEKTRILGHHCADNMRGTINSSHYNLKTLSESIKTETLSTVGGVEVGVGRISELPFYYELFDVGFKPGNTNKFVPLGSFGGQPPQKGKSGGKWSVGTGKWTFEDTNTFKSYVEGLDYIGKSIRELEIELDKTVKELGSRLIDKMGVGGTEEIT